MVGQGLARQRGQRHRWVRLSTCPAAVGPGIGKEARTVNYRKLETGDWRLETGDWRRETVRKADF
jgi:hypothetical protein